MYVYVYIYIYMYRERERLMSPSKPYDPATHAMLINCELCDVFLPRLPDELPLPQVP